VEEQRVMGKAISIVQGGITKSNFSLFQKTKIYKAGETDIWSLQNFCISAVQQKCNVNHKRNLKFSKSHILKLEKGR
jgi:hypothetical protein